MATLQEIYADGDELEMNLSDLEQAVETICLWLDGGDVDPSDAHYLGMTLLSLSRRAPTPEEPGE